MKYLKLVNGPDGSPQGISFYTEQGDQEDHVSGTRYSQLTSPQAEILCSSIHLFPSQEPFQDLCCCRRRSAGCLRSGDPSGRDLAHVLGLWT